MKTARAEVRQSRQEIRQRIVEAATELVRSRSFAELTVDDVMSEAGFGRTIFYRHFDDLADLVLRAGKEAVDELYAAMRAFSEARIGDSPGVVRAGIAPAVRTYERHGPLLRAITEAAAGDDEVARDHQAMRERFNVLVEEALRASPHLMRQPAASLAETARALNLMNETYLLDAFGRDPRVTANEAIETLAEVWIALIHRGA